MGTVTTRTRKALAALIGLGLLATACGSSSEADEPKERTDPKADVISGVHKNGALASRLPEKVRKAGRIRVATAAKGSPPVRYYPEGSRELVGVEIDIQKAVGKVLGVRMEGKDVTFDEIIPAIRSGKYDVGQGNFGVTEERKELADFVTYYDDGFGFLVPAGRKQKKVRRISDLCGLRLGTNAGTSFEQVLHAGAGDCKKKGKKPYHVSVYRGTADSMLALSQKKMDVMVLSSVFLKYAADREPKRYTYVNKIYAEHIGFLLDDGSPLSKPLQGAVQELIDDGTYKKIMRKWGIENASIPTSRINPPGLK